MKKTHADLIIVGGGASGQAAAIAAASGGYSGRILILEKEKKCGRKILASGNGRCNLSHRPLSAADYRSHHGQRLKEIIQGFPRDMDLALFERCGIAVKKDEQGRLYPLTEEALTVQSLLQDCIERLGIEVCLESEVSAIRLSSERISLELSRDGCCECRELILAGGGSAAPHLGGSACAAELCRSLGLQVYPDVPSLSAWILGERALCKTASGARFKGTARMGSHVVSGEFLFTDDGISGIAAMEMGLDLALTKGEFRGKGKEEIYRFQEAIPVEIDLIAARSTEELTTYLEARAAAANDWRACLKGCVHSRILAAIVKARGRQLEKLACSGFARLAAYLKHFPLEINGLRGFYGAQTSFGGVALTEVDDDLRLIKEPRISLCGELLDVSGNTGGYNLFFAFASGMTAGLGKIRAGGAPFAYSINKPIFS